MCKTQVRNGGAKVTHVGYARVSTDGQSLDAQVGELEAAGAVRVFQEKISGAVHASNSTSPRFAGSGFSARGFARIRWRATRVTQSASRASFSLVARTGNIAGMRNWLRNVDEIQRVCDHGRAPTNRRSEIAPNDPIRLSTAASLAFPDGSMTSSGLRKEALRGRLIIERIAGKDFTTLAHIERMRELCRVSAKARDSTNARPKEETDVSSPTPSGPSAMETARLPQESLRAKLSESHRRRPRKVYHFEIPSSAPRSRH
jgi:hypothetical protein